MNILAILFTYDRYEMLIKSMQSMFRNPGLDFNLWVVDNGSYFSNMYGEGSGNKQLNLLVDYYKEGKIKTLLVNSFNPGCNHSINQLMALAKLTSQDPKIDRPDFVFSSNDDMIFEDNWLKVTYDTYMTLEEPEKVKIVSPFHCYHLNGQVAHGMHTIKTVSYNGIQYEIKRNVSGNTWFMRGTTWLDLFDWYVVNHPTEGADWQKLAVLNKNGYFCAVTPNEMAHHDPDAQGRGKFNRLGHW